MIILIIININMISTDDIFQKLLDISINPQLEIKEGIQTLKTNLKFNHIFDFIKSKHWHSNESNTKLSHHSESLYDHSMNTGKEAYNNALSLGLSEKECIKMFITGLFHDIGKPGTYTEGTTFVGFKGHGIMGSAILENLWSDEINDIFQISKDDWGDICICTAVHMCGYFPTQNTDYHSFYFSILPPKVKKMLSILRIADQISLVPHPNKETDNKDIKTDNKDIKTDNKDIKTDKDIKTELINSQEKFNDSIKMNYDIEKDDIINFLNKNKLDKGLIFYINGTSASGKTTYALNLIKNLISLGINKTHISNISRDLYIINYYLRINKLNKITDDEITPDIYKKAYSFYESNKKENFKIINLEISNDIAKMLMNGGIVVIHSLITMFPSINSIIPDIAIDTPKISIWINRNKLISISDADERLGLSIDAQINLHGNYNLFNPLLNLNWYNLISITEFNDDNMRKMLDKSRSHLSITTGWNNCSIKNINYILENVVFHIYNYNQSISRLPSLVEVNNMTDIELLEYLGSIEKIKEFFNLYQYKVYIIDNIVGIKYIDGINKIWKPLWARKMRGKYYYINPITSKVIVIKDSLIRGMEILPKKYEKDGIIKTQDTNNNDDNSNFDSIQQELITLFKGDNLLTRETFITLKVDGSLIVVNIYPVKSEQYTILNSIIETNADQFTKLLANYCKENKLPLITISTNGTLFIGNLMQDYFLTSIQNLVSVEVKSLSDWEIIIPTFTKIFMEYYKNVTRLVKNNNPVSICFESICKNRTTFLGNVHNELAVNYDNNNLILLGLCNNNKYYPHFKLPRIIFTQPWYMSITTTTQVFNILDMMHQIVCGIINKDELFKMGSTIDSFMSTDLHVEGLILLSYLENGLIDYEKIKTKEYYICHNIKKDNMTTVFNYHKNYDNYYPILKNIRNFTENLESSLLKIIDITFNKLVEQINQTSPFYKSLNVDAQKCIDKIINNQPHLRCHEPLVCDTNINIGTGIKIFLNNKNSLEELNKLFIPIIEDIYKNRVGTLNDFVLFIKNVLMVVKPWINDSKVIINDIITNTNHPDNKIITELYILIIGL
jgi:putative nucleotidyltransferase with HDIG domain